MKPADWITVARSRSQEQPSKIHAHGRRRTRCVQRVGVPELRGDVLGEAEPPSGSQDAANLGEDGVGVAHAAQDEAGDDRVGAGVGQVDPFTDDAADLEIDAA